eukprot:TRINITY_DN6682_c0_g1_i2.p1 TRINITY_DN6682_c0_g1~~TRINITY_DN6682_c0_g1_i2.p1  ORF type:complete len:653 (-),score=223.52 TRINITY_DN6682_c0_g1_i2:35-1993(-)
MSSLSNNNTNSETPATVPSTEAPGALPHSTSQPFVNGPFFTDAQDSFLKHHLLTLAIQHEADVFFDDPTTIQHTTFLSYLYTRLMQFPLLDDRPEAKAKLNELIMSFPQITTASHRATKRGQDNKHFRQLAVKVFDLILRTPQERKSDEELLAKEMEDEQHVLESDAKIDATDKEIGLNTLRMRAELSSILSMVVADLNKKQGFDNLLHLLKGTKTITALPPLYQKATNLMAKIMAVWTEREMRDPKQVSKLKKIHMLTPIKAIRGVLAITNPARLLSSMISMFLMRPFGSYNLMQKFSEVVVETKKTDAALRDAQKAAERAMGSHRVVFRKNVLAKIAQFVNNNYTVYEAGEADDLYTKPETEQDLPFNLGQDWRRQILVVICDARTIPELDMSEIQRLTPDQLMALHEVLLLERRRKEKTDFVELLGDQKMTSIVRELLPVIHQPIAVLFCKASIGSHVDHLFKTVKRILKVIDQTEGKKSKVDVRERVERLEDVFRLFMHDVYQFLHHIACTDDGTLEKSFKWMLSMYNDMQKEDLRIQTLLTNLDSAEADALKAELDSLIRYKEWLMEVQDEEQDEDRSEESAKRAEEHAKNKPPRPLLVVMPRLVGDFVDMTRWAFAPTPAVSPPPLREPKTQRTAPEPVVAGSAAL